MQASASSSVSAFKDQQLANIKHSFVEAKRSKCVCCLGVTSVFIAVVVVALARTVLTYTPIYFLKIAELNTGEIDSTLYPDVGAALNYKAVEQLFRNTEYAYNTPRITLDARLMSASKCGNDTDVHNRTDIYTDIASSYGGFGFVTAGKYFRSCVHDFALATLFVIEFEKEKEIGLGRSWMLPAPKTQQVYLSKTLADAINAHVGDEILMEVNIADILKSLNSSRDGLSPAMSVAIIPLTVGSIYLSPSGKYEESLEYALMLNYQDFFPLVAAWSNPSTRPDLQADLNSFDPWSYATSVIFNLPPPRLSVYTNADFTQVEKTCLTFANHIVQEVGYGYVTISLALLKQLNTFSLFSLFLGLVISLIVFVLAIMLMLLIYSLLMVSVETRTFDLGVLRMVGMTRGGVIRYIMSQTLVTAIPAWVAGLIVSWALSSVVLSLLSNVAAIEIPLGLSTEALAWASFMGVAVPIFASILPVRAALSQTLTDALDINRSKIQGVVVTLERSSDERVPKALLICGGMLTLAGIGTYYLFPLALLYGNLQLLLYIFFGLLLGMLLGLVILGLNLERSLERFVVFTTLWWTSAAVRALVLKNLIAHRIRNRKTTILYSLSLGFIIFITVSFATQISTFTYQEMQTRGALLALTLGRDQVIPQDLHCAIDATLKLFPEIGGYTWYSGELRFVLGLASTNMYNIGKTFQTGQHIYAVSPNFLDVVPGGFLDMDAERYGNDASLTLTEQLYTPAGGQSGIIGSIYQTNLALDLNSSYLVQLQPTEDNYIPNNYYSRMRPLAFSSGFPKFMMSKFPNVRNQDMLVSFPTYVQLSHGRIASVAEIKMRGMLMKVDPSVPKARVAEIKKGILKSLAQYPNMGVYNFYESTEPWTTAMNTINFFGFGTSILVMIVCFFSLTSSMYANIHEQAREAGVLRAIGVQRKTLVLVYVLEAFVLVLAASIMGLMIGSIIGWTITAQRAVFTQLPVPFSFPTNITVLVVCVAIVSAVLSSFVPAMRLLKQPIVKIMRTI